MLKSFFHNWVYPVATLSGSIIGVGFLSLPYVTSKVGLWPMLLYFAVLAPIVVYLHVILGKISLKTPDFMRFPGFVGYYSGKKLEAVSLALTILGSLGALLVYLIVGGQLLMAIFSPVFGGSYVAYVVAYSAVLSLIVFFGITLIERVEFWALALLLGSLVVIFFKGFSQISWGNILGDGGFAATDWKTLFLPYGAIIFALWGTGTIPETEEMLGAQKKSLKKVIITALLIPVVIYLLFIFLILGITGSGVVESALPGLQGFLNGGLVTVALGIGVLTTCTAFIANGLFLKRVFVYDMKLSEFPAWALACITPLALFLIGLNSFIDVIAFIGGVLLSLNGIFILLIYKKIGGPKAVIYPLMAVFFLGIAYSIIYFIS